MAGVQTLLIFFFWKKKWITMHTCCIIIWISHLNDTDCTRDDCKQLTQPTCIKKPWPTVKLVLIIGNQTKYSFFFNLTNYRILFSARIIHKKCFRRVQTIKDNACFDAKMKCLKAKNDFHSQNWLIILIMFCTLCVIINKSGQLLLILSIIFSPIFADNLLFLGTSGILILI